MNQPLASNYSAVLNNVLNIIRVSEFCRASDWSFVFAFNPIQMADFQLFQRMFGLPDDDKALFEHELSLGDSAPSTLRLRKSSRNVLFGLETFKLSDDACLTNFGTAHPYLAACDALGGIHWYAGPTYERARINALQTMKEARLPQAFFKRAERVGIVNRIWQFELSVPEAVWHAIVTEDTSAAALGLLDNTITFARRVVSGCDGDTKVYSIPHPEAVPDWVARMPTNV